MADPFPNYRPILDKSSFMPATIDRSKFVKTLRRSTCLLSGQFIATKFSFQPHTLRVSMHNKEVGNLEDEIPWTSPEEFSLDIRFYAPYLLNGLQSFTEDKVQLFLKNGSKPIIFESQSNSLQATYLVMPVSPSP
ncbi:MAG TPA: hypothetical protein VHA52_07745, partial [Candidatus Babeliaceae bacterium]|nr:hypothetical protein [Candidatus Babeliaceae bacterium]